MRNLKVGLVMLGLASLCVAITCIAAFGGIWFPVSLMAVGGTALLYIMARIIVDKWERRS